MGFQRGFPRNSWVESRGGEIGFQPRYSRLGGWILEIISLSLVLPCSSEIYFSAFIGPMYFFAVTTLSMKMC